MKTLDAFQLTAISPIVNVASVRHLSPFRYPGGKTWLVPKVLSTLKKLARAPLIFVDPFLGGGSIPLAAIVEGGIEEAVLCEIDPSVAAVWKIIFSSDWQKLCERILNFQISRDSVLEVLSRPCRTTIDLAFQTIVKNRTYRGGILANGASMVKVGEAGRGVSSRWYPETLVKRIELLSTVSSRITFIEGDGVEVLEQFASDPEVFLFIDPPYTAGKGKRAGSRLYDHSDVDHEKIFATLECGRAPFMMTYDDDLDVLAMSLRSGFVLQHVPMKNTHHRCVNELLITRH